MKIITAVLVVMLMAGGVCCAGDKFCVIEKKPQAKHPVGAVVETTGVFVGKIASAVEVAFTGERKITVENETGECKIFPFCATTKVADRTFNAVTFNKLQKGECVEVKYVEEDGVVKAKEVIVEKKAQKAQEPSGTK